MSIIGKLKVMLGLDSSEFERNAQKATEANDALNESLKRTRQTQQSIPSSKPIIDPKQTQQATRSLGTLNTSIQQVARELPSLAMGPQMFFLAISNNLPILTDEIAKARKEYEALVASGKKATPVWKQLLKGIVSWQTALVVGITLLVAYGKDIGNFFSELFTGRESFDAAAAAAQNFNNAMAEGAVNAVEEITKLDLLYQKATDTTSSIDERRIAVEKLQELYPAYFANLNAEQFLTGQAVTQYDNLRASILKVAQARAAYNTLVSATGDIQLLENAGVEIDKIKSWAKEVERLKKMQEELRSQRDVIDYREYDQLSIRLGAELIAANKTLDKYTEQAKDQILASYGGKELWDKIEEQFDGNILSFFNTATGTIDKVKALAGESLTMPTPDDFNEKYQQWQADYKKAQEERKGISQSTLAAEEEANKKAIEFLQSQEAEYGNTLAYLEQMLKLKEESIKFAQSDDERRKLEAENELLRQRLDILQNGSIADGQKAIDAFNKIISDIDKKTASYDPKITVDLELNKDVQQLGKEVEDSLANNDFLAGLKSQTEQAEQLANEFKSTLASAMTSSLQSLGEAIGGMKSMNANEAVASLLSPLADMAISAGTLIMLSGEAIEALRNALTSFLGISAVAAGAALVAIGVAAKAGLSALANSGGKGSSASAPSYNTYTGGYKGGYSNSGAYTNAAALVQPAGTNITVDVSGKLKGEDIALAVKKVTYNKSR